MHLPPIPLRVQRRISYVLIAVGFIVGIWRDDGSTSLPRGYGYHLDGIQARGVLVVLTRNAPTTYYIDRNGNPAGYEYELAEDFAGSLGVDTHYVIMDTVGDILEAIRTGQGDIAAAGLTRTPEREELYRFGPSYKQVRQQLVCNRTGEYPRRLEDLPNYALEVTANSSYEERLEELSTELGGLSWRASSSLDTEGILARVAAGEVDCAIADSNILAINRRYEPDLIVPFDVSEAQQLAWALPPGAIHVSAALDDWFQDITVSNYLEGLDEQFYGHVDDFSYFDMSRFESRVAERLPPYREWFEQAAAENDLNWTLLAAVAYQESHWDPRARSPTGVRGLMMLTLDTAGELGVTSRLDPEQSIFGGARYLISLHDRLPVEVQGEDRLYFALAAYNVGLGHVLDAMSLARLRGFEGNTWQDLQQVLPLLSRRAHYSGLRYGYARGGQAVIYVQHIRDYQDLLNRTFPAHDANTGSAFPLPEGSPTPTTSREIAPNED